MSGIEKLQRNWYVMIVPAGVIIALLGSVGLPMLFPALNSSRFRFGLIIAVVVVFGAVAGWRAWRGRRNAGAIAEGIATPDQGEADAAAVSTRLREALAELRKASGRRKNYLYAKPWYVIIGPPGAGKTSAFLNSGLRFPYADGALKGEGGTRNLDFWFTDDAVLVDTAGRYTTQDSDPRGDAKGWERFLTLLRRTRPLEPVNGIIVTIGVDMLVSEDRERIDAHAAAIRRRLQELRSTLRVAAPVYLLLTKTDLLEGFGDFFADLAADGRRAVLGGTLAIDEPVTAATMTAAFDRMVEAIDARTAKRLQDEPDRQRRSRIIGFSAQLLSLRERFARLVGGMLPEDDAPGHRLRGFYFASSKQEGSPIDRLLASLATSYDGIASPAATTRTRAFFLNRLFAEVMFPEAGLVEPEPVVQRRRHLANIGGIAAFAAVAIVMLFLWDGSFQANKGLQAADLSGARAAAAAITTSGADLAEVRADDPDLEQMLPVLDRLRALPGGYAAQLSGRPSWRMRLGLYQSGHAQAARATYLEALQRIMLPRLLLELEQALRTDAQTPIRLYDPLKTYLMLGGYGPIDARAVGAWVRNDWATTALPGADREDVRRRLAEHLDALLADDDLGRVWANRRAPLDGRLLAQSRAAVIGLPLADRAYAMLRQRAAASGHPDWLASAVMAESDGRAFRNGDAVMALSVPWFFTRDGYKRAFGPGLADIGAELDRDLWVLGSDGAKVSVRDQLTAINDTVARSYAQDYIAAWDQVLATPQPANYFGDRQALGSFTRTPSPLRTLLDQTVKNTTLGTSQASTARFDAGTAIQAHFRPAAAFTRGEAGAPPPVDALVQAVRQAASAASAGAMPGANVGGDALRGQFASALGDLSTAGVSAPPQLQSFVGGIGRNGRGAAARTTETMLNDQYSATILASCRTTTDRRFPFDAAATTEVSPAELQRVYGNNGEIDGFVRGNLQPLLVQAPERWRWRTNDTVASRFSPSSADAFRKAAAIRDLTAGGLVLQVSLQTAGADVTTVDLAVGNTRYALAARDPASYPIVWTPTTLPQASLALMNGTQTLSRIDRQGSFALFRLIAAADRMQNAGAQAIVVWFGDAPHRTALRVTYASADNPFARNGPFSFRCPERL